MSYKSPIEIVYGDLKSQIEGDIYSVVQSYGINVDKHELIKALEYDRDQYDKGYADAKAEMQTAKVKRPESTLEQHQWDGTCEKCGGHVYQGYKYCQYCGARLEWK